MPNNKKDEIVIDKHSDGMILSGPKIERIYNAKIVRPLANGSVFINVADLIDKDSGKSFRELNIGRIHKIPLGALVEFISYNGEEVEWGNECAGSRLYVVGHLRDCDGTPLYALSINFKSARHFRSKNFWSCACATVSSGYSEECMKIVKLPDVWYVECEVCNVLHPKRESCSWCEDDQRREEENRINKGDRLETQ